MIHHATADIRIQTIMLAWAFGALLEGLVGFGFPWAVVVPILVGLGIADLDAIRVAALANNAPVSYGALGAPILGLAAVTGLPMLALSASIGNVVAILALLPPWVLIYLVSGWEGMIEAWPLAIVGSLSYVLGQWPVAHFLGPYLPDLSGALVSFWVLFIFVKIWRPKTIRGFGGKPLAPATVSELDATEMGSVKQAFDAWIPFLVLILVVVGWTGPWSHLPSFSLVKMSVAGGVFRYAQPDFIDLQFCAAGRRHIDAGFVADNSADHAAHRRASEAGIFAHVQANVGRAARRVFYFRARLHIRLHRDGQLAGLRPLQNRGVLRRAGAGSGLDWRGALRKQHFYECDVRSCAGHDRHDC